MYQLVVLYESIDGSLLCYSSDHSETESGHPSFYTVEYSNEASNSSEASSIGQNVQDLFQAVRNLM